MPPDVFVALAEDNGLIDRLTARVMAMAGRDLGPLLGERTDISLCLNISADDLRGPALEAGLDEHFLSHGVQARQIVLELTERRLTEGAAAKATLERLHGRGFRIAIDDFGTGYSSLAALRALPFTELKIDRSFVRALNDEALKASLLPQILDIAATLSLTVVAEGVETPAEQEWLSRQGVNRVQGWLYSHALTPEDFAAYVDGTRSGQPVR